MKTLKTALLVLLCIPLIYYSCSNSSNTKGDSSGSTLKELATTGDPSEIKDKIFYSFPSPEEVFAYIEASKLEFDPAILNPVSNGRNYLNLTDQSLNLGVYISDLAYITLFNQQENSLAYFEVIHKLTVQLKISEAFSESLYNRIQENLDNVDSLVVISGQAYQSIVDYLSETEQENISALVSMGAYVECLYLLLSYVVTFDSNDEMLNKVLDQKFAINNLYEFASAYQKDKMVSETLPYLKEIKDLFDAIEEKPIAPSDTKSDDKALAITGGTDLHITQEQFNKLKETVNNTRNNFIK
jgi:hypothetical protein